MVKHFIESPERVRRKPISLGASRIGVMSRTNVMRPGVCGSESADPRRENGPRGARNLRAKLAAGSRKRTSHMSSNWSRHRIPSATSKEAGDRTGDNRPFGVGSESERARGSTAWMHLGRGSHRLRKEQPGPVCGPESTGTTRQPVSAGRWAGSRKTVRIENTPRGLRLPRGFSRLGSGRLAA